VTATIRKWVLGGGCALLLSTASLAATKFDRAEYLRLKTEGQKEDDYPVKGSISFDKENSVVRG
jgi:hypothetical protein